MKLVMENSDVMMLQKNSINHNILLRIRVIFETEMSICWSLNNHYKRVSK